MIMIFNLLIIIISCALNVANMEALKIKDENLAHVTNDSSFDPIVLKRKNELIFISFPKINSKIVTRINSNLNSNSSDFSCEFEFDNPNDSIFQSPRAEVLGNDNIVVTFVETRYKDEEKDPKIFVNFYTLDSGKECLKANFSIPTDYKVLTSYDPLVIVPYNNTFDVFISSEEYCKPSDGICMIRYNDQGESLGVRDFNFSTSSLSFDLEKIFTNTEFNSSDGYVYISRSNSTLLKLNEDLQIVKSRKLKGFVRSISVRKDSVGVCSRIYDSDLSTECLKLDSNLKIQDRFLLGSSSDIRTRSLHNLQDGSLLLMTVERGKKTKVEVRRLIPGGFVSEPEEYSFYCNNFVANPPGRFIELKGVYCFVFQCKYKGITHCFNAADAKNLTIRSGFDNDV